VSKGSNRRPTDEKKFSDEYDRIFGKPSVRKGEKAIKTQVHVDKKKEAKKRGELDGGT